MQPPYKSACDRQASPLVLEYRSLGMSITEVLSCRLGTQLGSHSCKTGGGGFLQFMSAPTQWLDSVPSCQSFWLKKRNQNAPLANTVGLCFSNSSPGEQMDFLLDLCHLCSFHMCAGTRVLGCMHAYLCVHVEAGGCYQVPYPGILYLTYLFVYLLSNSTLIEPEAHGFCKTAGQ